MKTMKIGRLVLAIAGVLMAGGLAGAQGPGGGPGMGPIMTQHRPPMEGAFGPEGLQGRFWNRPNVVQQLNLTDDQRKAMDGILHSHLMTLVDLQANLKKAELEMQPLMSADTPNRAAIEAQIDKVVQARAELEKANARFLLDIRMQLKPEQWKQLQTMRANRMERERQGGWGQGGQRPGMRGPGMRGPQAPPPPDTAPQGAPAPPSGSPAPGTGEEQ